MNESDGNGTYVTRAELAAHIRRFDDNLAYLREGIDELRGARSEKRRWIAARAGAAADRVLPAGLAAAGTYALTRFFHRTG